VLDKEQFFDELKQLYRKKVLPLELSSKYAQFHSAPLAPADFDAKVRSLHFTWMFGCEAMVGEEGRSDLGRR
jgi:hypothetical protein